MVALGLDSLRDLRVDLCGAVVFFLIWRSRPGQTGPPPTLPPEQVDDFSTPPQVEEGPSPQPPSEPQPPPEPQLPPAPPVVAPAPPKQCGVFERKLIRTVEGQWKHQSSRTVSIPPSSDPVTVVVWEKTIYNEFGMFSPCPLPVNHGGDHEGPLVPESNEREAVRTISQEESYPYSSRSPKPPKGLGLPVVRD